MKTALFSAFLTRIQAWDSAVEEYLQDHWALQVHGSNRVGRIVTVLLSALATIIIFQGIVKKILVKLRIIDSHLDPYDAMPVHCAHIYVKVHVMDPTAPDPLDYYSGYILKFHIEFGPEDFQHEEKPELGPTAGHLRRKLTGMIAEAMEKIAGKGYMKKDDASTWSLYKPLGDEELKPENLALFNKKKLIIDKDTEPLCLQGVETGHTIICVIKPVEE